MLQIVLKQKFFIQQPLSQELTYFLKMHIHVLYYTDDKQAVQD